MKDRPILFTPENAQKCHDGTKTQTRRIMKPQPELSDGRLVWSCDAVQSMVEVEAMLNAKDPAWAGFHFSPYGAPGDRLWVRETWAKRGEMQSAIFKAEEKRAIGAYGCVKWKPSIHMPKWACRTWLEITEIRVQRLQEISEEDAKAEGIERIGGAASCNPWKNYRLGKPGEMAMHCSAPTRSFMTLWESINGPGSWLENPWVWAITFKRVES